MNLVRRTILGSNRPAAIARKPSGRIERSMFANCIGWTLIIFTTLPEGLEYATRLATSIPTEGSALSRVIWLALLAAGAWVPLARSGSALKLLRQVNRYMLIFIVLAFLSVLWSIEPGITLRRVVRISTIFLDATALALIGWHRTRVQSLLKATLTSIMLGSLLFGMLEPDLAIEQSLQTELVGAWHGLAVHKNALGSLAATAVVLWVHAWLSKESKWWVTAVGGGASVACLILSRSSTSLMAAVFASLLLVMLLRSPFWLKRYLPYLVAVFVGVFLVYGLAVLHLVPGSGILLSPITLITGKDQTFSNRAAIWNLLIEHIALRPVIGTGFGAYWIGALPSSPSYQMLQRLYFYPAEGHNGYLDVINDLGVLGALVLLGYVVTYLRQGLWLFRVDRTQAALYLALLFQQLVGNLSESHWFNALSSDFVLMTIATVAMGRTLLDQHLQMRSPKPSAIRR